MARRSKLCVICCTRGSGPLGRVLWLQRGICPGGALKPRDQKMVEEQAVCRRAGQNPRPPPPGPGSARRYRSWHNSQGFGEQAPPVRSKLHRLFLSIPRIVRECLRFATAETGPGSNLPARLAEPRAIFQSAGEFSTRTSVPRAFLTLENRPAGAFRACRASTRRAFGVREEKS